MGHGSAISVFGSQGALRERLSPTRAWTARSSIAARPIRCLSLRCVGAHYALRKVERSFKVVGPGPADIDASRRPQFAELLRLASRRRRPQADRARDPRALEQQRRPLRRRGRLWRALSRTIPRRRSPMPGLDARGTGRRDLAGGRALRRGAGRCANVAAARRLHRPAVARSRPGGGRPAGRAARRTVAHHRAGGTDDRDRSLPPGRLGAHGQHALWARLALFEIAASRLASTGGLLADLLGRGASRAAGRAGPS